MNRYTVTFLPYNRSVEVKEGITISEAAQSAGAPVTNLCGGEGVCGKCRVQISKGKAELDEHSRAFFSKLRLLANLLLIAVKIGCSGLWDSASPRGLRNTTCLHGDYGRKMLAHEVERVF